MKGKKRPKGEREEEIGQKKKMRGGGKEKGDFIGVPMVESLDGPRVKVNPRNEGYV